ncbi:YkgJ family cysteine cluster protein [Ignisphaera sp. 4213-co]|uniref:YkgJ family cysteine cluster protein n=1 Tax=Ignisphaera cupida TaxID=3050454 RepID=A0ABD4Z8E5_9CREN|nr:YkgJ family cysteine cluster protein [Ignisphaera sp. 4213-co]MDK6029207.1 YkgJ family cysteine cluster protein [Ignisphaera sp. 4213-co]
MCFDIHMSSDLAKKLSFVNFGNICKDCKVNCCRRFYAVLLPEEEESFKGVAFEVSTPLGSVKAIGSRNGAPCPFLDEKGFCKVYSQRAFDCRLWPLLLYYDFNTGEKVLYLDLECPAAEKGLISKEFIDKVLQILKSSRIDVEWLKKYTLAPWPNRLKEIARFK